MLCCGLDQRTRKQPRGKVGLGWGGLPALHLWPRKPLYWHQSRSRSTSGWKQVGETGTAVSTSSVAHTCLNFTFTQRIHTQHWSWKLTENIWRLQQVQPVMLGTAFAQTLIKVIRWQKEQGTDSKWKNEWCFIVTVNLFVLSLWGFSKVRQWKTLNFYILHKRKQDKMLTVSSVFLFFMLQKSPVAKSKSK